MAAVAQALLPAQLGRSCIGGVTVQEPFAVPQVAPALRHPLLPAPANYPWYPYISLDSGNAPRWVWLTICDEFIHVLWRKARPLGLGCKHTCPVQP